MEQNAVVPEATGMPTVDPDDATQPTPAQVEPHRRADANARRWPTRTGGTQGASAISVAVGLAAAAALVVAGILLGQRLRPQALVTAAPAAGSASSSAQVQSASLAVGTAQAAADASTAQGQAAQAAAGATQSQGLLQSAQTITAQVHGLAAPTLARNPSATDPSSLLPPLEQSDTAIVSLVAQAQQAVAATQTAARGAAGIAASDAGAAEAASAAQAALSKAKTALSTVQSAATEIGKLVTQAESEVQAWTAVHAAPPGYFGAQVEDAPPSFGVQGCEVDVAAPGSPAAAVGLVGKRQRTDPVGDVITAITDATDGGAVWPVTDCAAFDAAMSQTRVGDRLTVAYYYRQVIWYELSGRWVLESGSTTLIAAPGSNCPAAITGAITPAVAGNRIQLTVNLSGPAGIRTDLGVILDTGGVETTFPQVLLSALGYHPFLPLFFTGTVPGAIGTGGLYHVPASALTVDEGGRYVPLATGELTVWGMANGSDYALGPDILKQGARFTTTGTRWSLTPPCPPTP